MTAGRWISMVACMVLILSAGCMGLGLEREIAAKDYYLLAAKRSAQRKESVTDAAIAVMPFTVAPAYDTMQFTYKTGQVTGKQDYYNRFFAPPGPLIAAVTRRWLSDAEVFSYVRGKANDPGCRYRLEGHVSALYGDYSGDGKATAVLELQVFLLDRKAPDPGIVFSHEYRETEPLAGDAPAALVKGWNSSLYHILRNFEQDLKKELKR